MRIRTMMRHYLLLVFIAFASIFMSGCWWDNCGGGTPNGGFTVVAVDELWPNCIPTQPGCPPGTPTPVPSRIGHPGAQVSGSWQCDFGYNCPPAQAFGGYINSYGSIYHFGIPGTDSPVYTDRHGNAVINYGRVNAVWNGNVVAWSDGSFNSPPCAQSSATGEFFVSLANAKMEWDCIIRPGSVTGPGPAFILSGSQPATITISRAGLGLTTSSGMPGLWVYNENALNTQDLTSSSSYSDGCDVGVLPPPPPPQPSIIATSVSPDGNSATFPFPKLGDGNPLPAGYYGFNIWNQSNPGKFDDMGMGFFAIGSNDTSETTPFGVDAANVTVSSRNCVVVGGRIYCSGGTSTTPYPILTLSSPGQVTFKGRSVGVGSQPVAVRGYAVTTFTTSLSNGGWVRTTEPSRAIVANFGSNTVSIVDLYNYAVVQTISVGTEPTAIALNQNQTKAYVANYGSATVSEIDLSTNTQTRVAGVGGQPEALAVDPSGTALWVGGLNYILKLDLGTFTVGQSFSVSGQVTSLAVSAGQNSLVYTTIATSGGSTTFQAQQASLSSGAVQRAYAQQTISSSSPYAQIITTGGPAPGAPGWLMPSGALVSSNYGNSAVVVGTPTGFAVIDLIRQMDLLDGTTPTPVRGIATVPTQGIAYLTAPDSNSVISVPLPVQHTAAQGTVTISGTEQTVNFDPCAASGHGSCPQTAPDNGTVSIMVDTAPIGVTYGSGDTPASIAARLVSAINGVNYPVLASANGGVLSLGATTMGTGPNNWALQATCKSNFAQYGVGCSFSTTTSGSTLSGGN
jgi:YVTN family beta-propeller protein